MRKRIKAAKNELDYDRSTFILGILLGVFIGVVLAVVIPSLFGFVGGFLPQDNPDTAPKPDINADIIVKDLRESDNRMLIQLTNETNADSIYVVTDSDNPSKLTSSHYLGSKGNPTSGSTVSVSIGSDEGDVMAQKGDTVRIIGVKGGVEVVLKKFTV